MNTRILLILSCVAIFLTSCASTGNTCYLTRGAGYNSGYSCHRSGGCVGNQTGPCGGGARCGGGCATTFSGCDSCNLSGCHQQNACGCRTNCGTTLFNDYGCQTCYDSCFGNIGHTDTAGCFADDP